MSFTKANIPIRVKGDKLETKPGYIFEACFSDGSLFNVGVFKDEAKDALHKTRWVVSDINTGLAINEASTRTLAVKNFQEVYCSKLERLVFSRDKYYGRSGVILAENYYEHMTNTFKQICAEQAMKVCNE